MQEFNFYGVRISISACSTNSGIEKKALDWLREDFEFFQTSESQENEIEFRLIGIPAPFQARKFKLFKTRMCNVFGIGRRRLCDYGDGSVVETLDLPDGRRVFNVYSQNEHELYEFAYVAFLSAVGEALDRRSFHRVHALGVSDSHSATLLLLPPGGGKSTLATKFLNSDLPISLFSDESPLLKDGVVYPFPNHIGLASGLIKVFAPEDGRIFHRKYFASKLIFQVPKNKISRPLPLQAVFIGRRHEGTPRITRLSKWRAFFELFKGIVIGMGLVQMAEFMLRGNNFFGLTRIAFSRLLEAKRTSMNIPCYEFILSNNAEENFQLLGKFLSSSSSSNPSFPTKQSQEIFPS